MNFEPILKALKRNPFFPLSDLLQKRVRDADYHEKLERETREREKQIEEKERKKERKEAGECIKNAKSSREEREKLGEN